MSLIFQFFTFKLLQKKWFYIQTLNEKRSHLKWLYQKTLHCLKNVKTSGALPQSNADQTVFSDSKLFGSSLISQRDWRGPLLAPPPAPPPAGARSETARQFLRRTFKFNSNEEEKKATKREKKETYRMKITLPLFLPKNVFPIKISVF